VISIFHNWNTNIPWKEYNFDQWDRDKNIPHMDFFSLGVNEEFAVFFSNDRERLGFPPAKQNPSNITEN
jgi:hypothetical protein